MYLRAGKRASLSRGADNARRGEILGASHRARKPTRLISVIISLAWIVYARVVCKISPGVVGSRPERNNITEAGSRDERGIETRGRNRKRRRTRQ